MITKRVLNMTLLVILVFNSCKALSQGVPVFDASNLAQLITQAQTLTQQLEAVKSQLDILNRQYATITSMYEEMRGITGHALMLKDPVSLLHNFLPAVDIDPEALLQGSYSRFIRELREIEELYSTEELFGEATHLIGAAKQYKARSDYVYSYMALAKEAYENISARRSTLEGFTTALTTASTEKSVLDLNTRIAAENALLLNDIAQLQALQFMAQMQERNLLHNAQGFHAARQTDVTDLDFNGKTE